MYVTYVIGKLCILNMACILYVQYTEENAYIYLHIISFITNKNISVPYSVLS